MNKVSDEKIINKLKEVYYNITQEYSSNNILGVFALGKANYGFLSSITDLKICIIYIPTFEEICFSNNVDKVWEEDKKVNIIDIRRVYFLGDKVEIGNDRGLELLYSKYKVINPKFHDLYAHLESNRETLTRYNEKTRLTRVYNRAIEANKKGDFFELGRLWLASKKYAHGVKGEFCFYISDFIEEMFLWQALHGQNDFASQAIYEIKQFADNADDTTNLEAEVILKNSIMEIILLALNPDADCEKLLNDLSNKEYQALEFLLDAVETEGNIVLSNLVTDTGISRPVYTKLIQKLQNAKIIKVKNQGTKGTYIKLLVPEIEDML